MKTYYLNTTMSFGKHNGQSIQQIIDQDPQYLNWCIINLDHFMLENELFENLKNNGTVRFQADAIATQERKYQTYLDELNTPEEDTLEYESRSTYDNYNGSYAQDIEGYSDQDIDDIFDGDPDAYWNID
jgi:hypothetical protein